jgi:hypothetical protein
MPDNWTYLTQKPVRVCGGKTELRYTLEAIMLQIHEHVNLLDKFIKFLPSEFGIKSRMLKQVENKIKERVYINETNIQSNFRNFSMQVLEQIIIKCIPQTFIEYFYLNANFNFAKEICNYAKFSEEFQKLLLINTENDTSYFSAMPYTYRVSLNWNDFDIKFLSFSKIDFFKHLEPSMNLSRLRNIHGFLMEVAIVRFIYSANRISHLYFYLLENGIDLERIQIVEMKILHTITERIFRKLIQENKFKGSKTIISFLDEFYIMYRRYPFIVKQFCVEFPELQNNKSCINLDSVHSMYEVKMEQN